MGWSRQILDRRWDTILARASDNTFGSALAVFGKEEPRRDWRKQEDWADKSVFTHFCDWVWPVYYDALERLW